MTQPKPVPGTLRVSLDEYRQATDHLWRIVNVDYHACVNGIERAEWCDRASRVMARLRSISCRCGHRATASQLDAEKAIAKAEAKIAEVKCGVVS